MSYPSRYNEVLLSSSWRCMLLAVIFCMLCHSGTSVRTDMLMGPIRITG